MLRGILGGDKIGIESTDGHWTENQRVTTAKTHHRWTALQAATRPGIPCLLSIKKARRHRGEVSINWGTGGHVSEKM